MTPRPSGVEEPEGGPQGAGSPSDERPDRSDRTPPAQSADELRRLARRRRELDQMFGDVLPEVTRDETGRPGGDRQDRWYAENRPPHHG